MGSQPWTVNSEIYPLHVRGSAMSIATTANWISNYLIAALFLTSTSTPEGKVATFSVIGAFGFFAFGFVYVFVPETKGVPLEEVVEMFQPGGGALKMAGEGYAREEARDQPHVPS